MAESSIVFLIPYFGRWPFWMPFFLRSCSANPSINWVLYSDCGAPEALPGNVRYVHTSYSAYCELVSSRLRVNFHPQRPYKLCDLKPALGLVHEADIAGFDFWGFSDLDVIYGQLRDYFTPEKLARYDFFSTHERRVSGHLCLMRNTQKMRTAFWQIPNYRERLCDEQSHALDEGAFSRIFLWRKNFPKPLFKFVGFFNPWRRKALFEELYSTPNAGRPWVDGSRNFPEYWRWRNGVVLADNTGERSFPYLHFYGWKKWSWGERPLGNDDARKLATADEWVISAKGFQQDCEKVGEDGLQA